MKKIEQQIKNSELGLLKPEIRKNKKILDELLADDFIEFTSVGTIINKKDVLRNLPKESLIKWKVSNLKTKIISKDVILATYKVQKKDLKNKNIIVSLRVSLWKNINNKWKIIFHQGTILK